MIHSTAIIDPRAQIDPTAEIGAYAIIDGPAQIAAGCRIESHAQIVGDVRVGAGTVIGRGAVIGAEPQDLSFDPGTESGVIIGEKNVIREHVTIHRGSKPGQFTTVGDGNFLMVGCHLGHDVRMGDKNVVANTVLFAGHVRMGNHTIIGGGSVFHQFIRIGDHCMIQGISGFGKDIPPFCVGYRVNRISGLNVIGLRRSGFAAAERAAIKELFELIYCSGKNLSQAVAAAREKTWPLHAEQMLQFIETPSKRGICGKRDDNSE